MRHMQNSVLQDTTHTDYKLFRIYITTFFRGWMTNNLAAESKNIFFLRRGIPFPTFTPIHHILSNLDGKQPCKRKQE